MLPLLLGFFSTNSCNLRSFASSRIAAIAAGAFLGSTCPIGAPKYSSHARLAIAVCMVLFTVRRLRLVSPAISLYVLPSAANWIIPTASSVVTCPVLLV